MNNASKTGSRRRRPNAGFDKANLNRTVNAIAKAAREGRKPSTDKKLAAMYDRIYGTTFLAAWSR